jgi:cytochrome c6
VSSPTLFGNGRRQSPVKGAETGLEIGIDLTAANQTMNALMRKIVLLITVCLAAGALAARAADAKENWEKQCQKCHGADGKGQTAMGKKFKIKDYTDAKVQASMKDEEILKTIKEGKKEGDKTLMKAYADVLSEAEIKDLVAYVRKLKK